MFHRSTRGDYRSVRTEHSEKQSHLGAVFPEGESGPFFLRIVPSSGSTTPERKSQCKTKKFLHISKVPVSEKRTAPAERSWSGPSIEVAAAVTGNGVLLAPQPVDLLSQASPTDMEGPLQLRSAGAVRFS